MDLPDKKYSVIYIDPPWKYANWTKAKNGAAAAHYDCMKTSRIAELPIGELGAKNSVMIMWVTGVAFAEARHIPILYAWGYKPVTTLFVWRKLTKAKKPICGIGFHTRHVYEYAVLARRGKFGRRKEATNVSQEIDDTQPIVIEETVQRPHSRKPAVVADMIRKLYKGPYVEIFARKRRPYWDSWGAQINLGLY
jgi:N6-adenosine-specific RNA methylase IME4